MLVTFSYTSLSTKFVYKAGAYPCAVTLRVDFVSFNSNIRICSMRQTATNTLAYRYMAINDCHKTFYCIGPWS